MRARNSQSMGAPARWLLAVLTAGVFASAWGQEHPAEGEPMPEPPKPPAAAEAPQADKQVRILRESDGTLRILARDENGEGADIQLDLGEEFGGALTRRIYQQLESKGILDDKGLVVDGAMNSVPKNTKLSWSGEIDVDSKRDYGRGGHDDFPFHGDLAALIPIVAILAVFGTPILIVWLVTRNSYRKKQLVMDNINRMVAEGRDIPPELLDGMERESPSNMKDRGFTLIAVGLALFIWLTISSGAEVGSLGLIPLFIGVARFINWKLDNQQNNQAG